MKNAQSPFTGLKPAWPARLLTRMAFMPAAPLAHTVALSRVIVQKYGRPTHLVLVGPPGAGKSELMRNLRAYLNVPGHPIIDGFATSSAVDEFENSGQVSKSYLAEMRAIRDSGGLLPDTYVRSALDYMFQKVGGTSMPLAMALDGAIRTTAQIRMVYDYAFVHRVNFGVIHLHAETDELLRRLHNRPEAASRADTAHAERRIQIYATSTEPALRLVKRDVGPFYLRVDTDRYSTIQTAFLALRHICHVLTAPPPQEALGSLIAKLAPA